jgi:hypothetical protein
MRFFDLLEYGQRSGADISEETTFSLQLIIQTRVIGGGTVTLFEITSISDEVVRLVGT